MEKLIIIFGITTILLLFPSLSKLSVFSNGEFTYPESIGIIFAYITLSLIIHAIISKKLHNLKIEKKLIKYALVIGGIGINVISLMMVITFVWIRFDVKTHCKNAMKDYGGNCASALSSQLMDNDQSFRSRNAAIWTLGQLANRQALPVLKSLYTGVIPKRESPDNTISQYELKKAIKWCEEGNITSWMY